MNIEWTLTEEYFSLSFDSGVRTLSSAILNGGCCVINSFINMKVDANLEGTAEGFPSPRKTIYEKAVSEGLPEPAAGMMTAASMNSFRYAACSAGGIDIYCFLTSGLSNALAAGDKGAFLPRKFFSDVGSSRFGTINIAAGISIPMTDAALAEALMIITEAKTSVLFDLGVKSSESGRLATGTGTDSVLVFCDEPSGSAECEEYCGKHTVLGEAFASVVRTALRESLKDDRLFL